MYLHPLDGIYFCPRDCGTIRLPVLQQTPARSGIFPGEPARKDGERSRLSGRCPSSQLLRYLVTKLPEGGSLLRKVIQSVFLQGALSFFHHPPRKQRNRREIQEKESLHAPVLLDKTGKVGRLFGVWVQPTSYLIDRRGWYAIESWARRIGQAWKPQASSILSSRRGER